MNSQAGAACLQIVTVSRKGYVHREKFYKRAEARKWKQVHGYRYCFTSSSVKCLEVRQAICASLVDSGIHSDQNGNRILRLLHNVVLNYWNIFLLNFSSEKMERELLGAPQEINGWCCGNSCSQAIFIKKVLRRMSWGKYFPYPPVC